MSSTTSKRLRRVWSIVDSAYETGSTSVSVAYLTAALEGGEKWAKLEALANEAPLVPEEYREFYRQARALGPLNVTSLKAPGPEYELWYDSEMDRLAAEQDKILNAPDVVL